MTATAPDQRAATTSVDEQPVTGAHSHHCGQCRRAREEFTAWLTASCERQALPVTVTDPATLAAIATLLR
jgi:hypothetical protein